MKNAHLAAILLVSGILMVGSSSQAAEHAVSMTRAREIAISAYPGKIESAELEQEKGRWVYSFDIRRAGQANIHETLVDADTGEIISQTTETPKQQADEKKADA